MKPKRSKFVPRWMSRSVACAGLMIATTAFAQVPLVVRGPYLQSVTTSNIIVRWRTDVPTESRVRYGTNTASLSVEAAGSAGVTEHTVTLPELTPDTRYFYSIVAGAQTLVGGPAYTFATPPQTAKPTRIWAIGDAGTAAFGSTAPHLVRNAYASYTGLRRTDVWLMLGDNAYYSGTDTEYQAAVFEVFQEMLRTTTVWPTLGNHETYSAAPGGHMAYDDIFNLPLDGRAGGVPSGTERYYSFNHGNIHFVCLDSEISSRQPGSPMLTWLEQDLGANESDWTIAYWHSPPYSKGTHDSDAESNLIVMREHVVPLLEAYGVDLILCGHSHNYERTFLLHGHYGHSSSLAPSMVLDGGSGRPGETGAYLKSTDGSDAGRGAVYVVAGSSGQTGFGSFDHPAVFLSLNRLGSMVIDIDGDRLEAKFLRENGTVDDQFTILKGDQPPSIVSQPQNRTVVAGATATFSVMANGTRPLSYQWLFNDSPLAGATNATLTLNNVQFSQAGPYSVVVSNRVGGLVSVAAELAVSEAPACVAPPAGQVAWWPFELGGGELLNGHNALLVGTPLISVGKVLSGLVLDGIDDQAEVPASPLINLGLSTGFTLELWIKPSSIEANQPLLEWNNRQGSVGLQFWISQPPPAGNGAGCLFASLADTSGAANHVTSPAGTLSAEGDGWNHVALTYDQSSGLVRMYSNGAKVAERNIGIVVVQTSFDLFFGRRVAVTGSNYRFQGNMDEVSLYNRALTPAEIQSIVQADLSGKCVTPTPPRILLHPQGTSVYEGLAVELSVAAEGSAPLTYQWLRNDVPVMHATNPVLSFLSVQLADAGTYRVIVSNTLGTSLSLDATLTVNIRPPCAMPLDGLVAWWPLDGNGQDVAADNNALIVGNPSFADGMVGAAMDLDGVDDQGEIAANSSINLGAAPGLTLELWIRPDSVDAAQPLMEWNNRQGSVGLQFWIALPAAGGGSGSLFASFTDTSGGVQWVSSSTGLLVAGQWQHVALTYDKTSGLSRLFLNGVVVREANIGQRVMQTTYDLFLGRRVAVSGSNYRFAGGMDEVSIYARALLPAEIQTISISGSGGKCRPVRPPVIITQPTSQMVVIGDSAGFAVTASGTVPLSYQWLFGNEPITGATNASLALNNVQLSDAGEYSVVVSNAAGITSSAPATLTVVFPPATLRLADAQGGGGTSLAVPVLLTANGNENALGFSIVFDPMLLSFQQVEPGANAPDGLALVINPADAAQGRVGVALALAADATFPDGTQEVARVVFTVAPALMAVSTPLAFGNSPTLRQISDAEARVLTGHYVGGTVLIFPTELEGDVAPRPDGDRTATIIDWVQMGRFVASLNAVSSSNEFQRADCAPRSTRGNGVLGVTDWVQAGRYAAGLDPITPVGGPVEESAPAALFLASGSGSRVLSLRDSVALPGTTSNVPVQLAAQGNENAFGFSVSFDATLLRFIGASPGSASANAVFNINASQIDQGRVGLVLALPAGSVFPSGDRELAVLRFAPIDSPEGTTPLQFTDSPVRRESSDAQAEPVPLTYTGGVVSFQPPGPALNLSLSAGNVVLFWPAQDTDAYDLESSPQLGAAEWTRVNVRPIVIGGQRIVTLPASTGQAWFRLKKP